MYQVINDHFKLPLRWPSIPKFAARKCYSPEHTGPQTDNVEVVLVRTSAFFVATYTPVVFCDYHARQGVENQSVIRNPRIHKNQLLVAKLLEQDPI